MTIDNEYFLELEKNASEIVGELDKLRDEASKYSNSSKALAESVEMIGKLTEGLGKASDELSSLSQSIREQGFSVLTNSLEEIKSESKSNYEKFNKGFSVLTNSLEEIKSESKSNYEKFNKLILAGFGALTLMQLMVLVALLQHL